MRLKGRAQRRSASRWQCNTGVQLPARRLREVRRLMFPQLRHLHQSTGRRGAHFDLPARSSACFVSLIGKSPHNLTDSDAAAAFLKTK